uniref:Uncharacterized protein n=1 Tax=Glossina palpalis gambiensis TaxID=67801 RepID=A0A1B0C448_9MUSC
MSELLMIILAKEKIFVFVKLLTFLTRLTLGSHSSKLEKSPSSLEFDLRNDGERLRGSSKRFEERLRTLLHSGCSLEVGTKSLYLSFKSCIVSASSIRNALYCVRTSFLTNGLVQKRSAICSNSLNFTFVTALQTIAMCLMKLFMLWLLWQIYIPMTNIVDNDQHSFVYSLDVELTPRGEVLKPLAIVAIYRFSHPTLRAFSVRVKAPRSQERPPQVPQPAPPQMLSQGSPLRSQTSLFNSGIMAEVTIARNAILLQSVAEISITAQLAMITSSVVQTFYTIPHTTIAVTGIINIDIVAAVTFLARSPWFFGVAKLRSLPGFQDPNSRNHLYKCRNVCHEHLFYNDKSQLLCHYLDHSQNRKFLHPKSQSGHNRTGSLRVSSRVSHKKHFLSCKCESMQKRSGECRPQVDEAVKRFSRPINKLPVAGDKGEAATNGGAATKQFNHYVMFLRSVYSDN